MSVSDRLEWKHDAQLELVTDDVTGQLSLRSFKLL